MYTIYINIAPLKFGVSESIAAIWGKKRSKSGLT